MIIMGIRSYDVNLVGFAISTDKKIVDTEKRDELIRRRGWSTAAWRWNASHHSLTFAWDDCFCCMERDIYVYEVLISPSTYKGIVDERSPSP